MVVGENEMIAWDVYLVEKDYGLETLKWIDTVFYTVDCDKDYVRSSLINHDCYNPNIVVKRSK